MMSLFPCIQKENKSKMWQWQGSNDCILTSTLLNFNCQQIITMMFASFYEDFHFSPKCCFEYFIFLITCSVSELLFWRTGKPCYQKKEVRDLFFYILPLFPIQTWLIFTFKIKCIMHTAQWDIFCNEHIFLITLC